MSLYDRPEAWVRRLAIRLAVRDSKRERIRSVLERQVAAKPVYEDDHHLSAALRQLSALQRAAVVLHYYEDRPIDEVATIVACSVSTVKSHLHRGRIKLRTLGGEVDRDDA